jgi:lysine-ketoglutarate reductase/saccharopine dehydrogenase-like protein (TIGR00300 family)
LPGNRRDNDFTSQIDDHRDNDVQDFPYREVIEIRGHIIDSNILPRILDEITDRGGDYDILTLQVGHRKEEPSYARMEVRAASEEDLEALIEQLIPLGATPASITPARLESAPADGVYPANFYSTTNLRTVVNLDGTWMDVAFPEMDCAILVEPDGSQARSITLNETRKGDRIVVGHDGIRVQPLERPRRQPPVFAFMGSSVSPEKPNPRLIREIAQRMRQVRAESKKILLVGGPVLIHTGSQPELVWLVEHGYIQAIFGGNGLATHDIEVSLYGTSLGVSIEQGIPVEGGHEHHLRAINTIRQAGGIRTAVEAGVLTSGLMHACVRHGVEVVLAGSIRDDGPLPDVITDTQVAQGEMRRIVRDGVGMVLILASMLHGIATGNLLPAEVTTVCVDIEPAVVTKLSDRGTFQNISVVADVGSFLRELVANLQREAEIS